MASSQLPSARANIHPDDHGISTLPSNTFDVVCLGTGWASRVTAARVVSAGLTAAIVEDELVGGDCPFWACVPSKVLLRPGETLHAATSVSGSREAIPSKASVDARATFDRRDKFTGGFSDAPLLIPMMEGAGVTIVRGKAALAGKKLIKVASATGETVEIKANLAVVLGVGSRPITPGIRGLVDANVWTPRDATSSQTVPEHLVVIGAGAVGTEMATAYASFGGKVTLVCSSPEVLPSVDPEAGKIVREALISRGVDVRVGAGAAGVERGADGKVTVTLSDGGKITGTEALLAAGRTGNHEYLNLQSVGAAAKGKWIPVNDSLAVETSDAEGWLYAAGDVTGRALTTHTSKYHGKIIANTILARSKGQQPGGKYSLTNATGDIHAAPQVIFTNPSVASVGLTRTTAAARDIRVREVNAPFLSLGGRIASDNAVEGWSQWLLDGENRLVGATFVGDGAGDVLHASTVAVVGGLTVERLMHAIPSFPTTSEVYLSLVDAAGL